MVVSFVLWGSTSLHSYLRVRKVLAKNMEFLHRREPISLDSKLRFAADRYQSNKCRGQGHYLFPDKAVSTKFDSSGQKCCRLILHTLGSGLSNKPKIVSLGRDVSFYHHLKNKRCSFQNNPIETDSHGNIIVHSITLYWEYYLYLFLACSTP